MLTRAAIVILSGAIADVACKEFGGGQVCGIAGHRSRCSILGWETGGGRTKGVHAARGLDRVPERNILLHIGKGRLTPLNLDTELAVTIDYYGTDHDDKHHTGTNGTGDDGGGIDISCIRNDRWECETRCRINVGGGRDDTAKGL